jgi:hypothetical protein
LETKNHNRSSSISTSNPTSPKCAAALALLGLLAPLFLSVNIKAPLNSENFIIRIDQRTRAAAERIRGRKIIFIGGSNLLFGLRADSLGRRVGMPIVNYGLTADLGVDIIAGRAGEIIGPGDLVVLATEAMHYPRVEYRNPFRAEFLAHVARERQLLRFDIARARCALLRQAVQRIVSLNFGDPRLRELPGPYALGAIGPTGTLCFPLSGRQTAWHATAPAVAGTDADFARSVATAALDALLEKCRQHGATLAVMPPFRLAEQRADSDVLMHCERRWLALATARGAAQLFGPGETLLDQRFGYDCDYHLNDAGVAIMETRLATALSRLLKSEPALTGTGERTAAPIQEANLARERINSLTIGVGN